MRKWIRIFRQASGGTEGGANLREGGQMLFWNIAGILGKDREVWKYIAEIYTRVHSAGGNKAREVEEKSRQKGNEVRRGNKRSRRT